jgi:prepilin peptidase CpaA
VTHFDEVSLFEGDSVRLAFGAVFTLLLAMACVTDVRARRIPNRLVAVIAVAGLVFSGVAVGGWLAVGKSLLGVALGFGIWIVFYAIGVLGAGDVKLAAAAGAWLGVGGIWRASLVAAVAGGVLAVLLLARERRMRETVGRIGLSVSTGSLALLRAGPDGEPTSAPARGRSMPYGVALAIGALVAAWFPGVLA